MQRYLREAKAAYLNIGTLTYPQEFKVDGKKVKRDIKVFGQRVKRRFANTKGFSLFWFLEFQANGQPHIHFFTTNFIHYAWLAQNWAEIVESGNPDHIKSGTQIDPIKAGRYGIASYASKYAKKSSQKVVPEGFEGVGRFWGIIGDKSVIAHTAKEEVHQFKLHNKGVNAEFMAEKLQKAHQMGKIRCWSGQIEEADIRCFTIEVVDPVVVIHLQKWFLGLYGRKGYQKGWLMGERKRYERKKVL